ncbi:MAG: ABC transporter substrate-binding protein, partial [Thiotrichales bacterium]|nr:ABC transporter substrate-binding protein [Thiotrichales bacterium]
MLKDLGINEAIPLLVWIFREDWADKNNEALTAFLDASYSAKKILANSDEEWSRINSLTRIKDSQTLQAVRKTYLTGVPTRFGEGEKESASVLFSLLSGLAGKKLVGEKPVLNTGTFYSHYSIRE